MEIRIKKRPSLSKGNKQKQQNKFNMTVSTAMFPTSQKQLKMLPPIKRNFRKPLQKISMEPKIHKKQRKQTQTTLNESSLMTQSHFFSTMSKPWIKPSDYLKNIQQLNLTKEQQQLQVTDYEIKLNDKMEQNVKKIQSLFQLTQKWVQILKRALAYVNSQKSTSEKLSQEVKFWRLLNKKFDELQYEFNNQKTQKLNILMKTSLKTKLQHRKIVDEFEQLKKLVTQKCVQVKKLYLSLQEVVAGSVVRFQQCSDIKQSIQLLKKILFCFNNIHQLNPLLQNRLQIIYKKTSMCLVSKLNSAPIYPRQLANISGLKIRYEIINNAISFYSNFISILEEKGEDKFQGIVLQAEYTRGILSNLMSILCYFEFLYKKREVLEFSKLFGYEIDFNIFDQDNKNEWEQYMAIVQDSMASKEFED